MQRVSSRGRPYQKTYPGRQADAAKDGRQSLAHGHLVRGGGERGHGEGTVGRGRHEADEGREGLYNGRPGDDAACEEAGE